MSAVIACGGEIRQVRECDAFIRLQLVAAPVRRGPTFEMKAGAVMYARVLLRFMST